MAMGIGCVCVCTAEPSFAPIFSDDMVLQQGLPLKIWGKASPGEAFDLSFANQRQSVRTDQDGNWETTLDPMQASFEPRSVKLAGAKGSAEISGVLVGEVWLASGQSNMEWTVMKLPDPESILGGVEDKFLRLQQSHRQPSSLPLRDVERQPWLSASRNSAKNFSAVAICFGQELRRKLNVPVGLIDCSWGGTKSEAWTSIAALRKMPFAAEELDAFEKRADKARLSCGDTLQDALSAGPEPLKETCLKLGWADMQPSGTLAWRKMALPAKWQERGMDVSGVFWFRKEVDLPAAWSGRELKLSLGAADKDDESYFNNRFLGSLLSKDRPDSYKVNRAYSIPGEAVKSGRNVIAVRVKSDFFDGGMTGPASDMHVSCPSLPDAPSIPLAGDWLFAVERSKGLCSPSLPTELFNGMINPLAGFAMRGAIWYQGESNESKPEQYRKLLPLMINDWRTHWGQGDFPFLIVQLAAFKKPKAFDPKSGWAQIREVQAQTADSLPSAGLACAIDIGDEKNPHPADKRSVGQRLAANAMAVAYGMKDVVSRGPVFKSLEDGDGNWIVRYAKGSTQGLRAKGGAQRIKGFVAVAADGRFEELEAAIQGDSVLLKKPSLTDVREVAYAWADFPICNLENSAGLPAEPFKTPTPK